MRGSMRDYQPKPRREKTPLRYAIAIGAVFLVAVLDWDRILDLAL